MKNLKEKICEFGRGAALFAGVGIGVAKIIGSLSWLSQKSPKTIKRFSWLGGGLAATAVVGTAVVIRANKRNEAKKYTKEREADAELYERQRRADGELYTIQKQAEERVIQAKAEAGVYRRPKIVSEAVDSDYSIPDSEDDEDEQDKTTWLENFKSRFTMPTLPPFLTQIMSGVPMGYEEAMLFHLLSIEIVAIITLS